MLGRALLFGLLSCTSLLANKASGGSNSLPSHEQDGVALSVMSLPDRIVFCIEADANHKISAEYGVEIKLLKGDKKLWREKFPKVITGPNRYFELPVRIDLHTLSHNVGGNSLEITFGACSSLTSSCNLIRQSIRVPEVRPEQELQHCGY